MTAIIIAAIVIIAVASLFIWFFRTAPFLQAPFNQWGEWLVIFIALICLLVYVVIPILHQIPGIG